MSHFCGCLLHCSSSTLICSNHSWTLLALLILPSITPHQSWQGVSLVDCCLPLYVKLQQSISRSAPSVCLNHLLAQQADLIKYWEDLLVFGGGCCIPTGFQRSFTCGCVNDGHAGKKLCCGTQWEGLWDVWVVLQRSAEMLAEMGRAPFKEILYV